MISAQGEATAELDDPFLTPKIHQKGLEVRQILAGELVPR
jgi:hypothetical protein